MKKLILLLILPSILLACAKSETVIPETAQGTIKKTSSIGKALRFTFDSVTNPDVWKTFQNLEEMLAACQIPNEILADMTTEELVNACMTHPLALNYLAYNNEMDGVKVVIDGFNGFKELQKRTDAPDELIAYYEKMDVDAIAERYARKVSVKESIKQGLSTLHVGYVELILSSGFIPSLYDTENISRIEKIRYDKLEAKLRHKEIFGMDAVSKSLLLGARVKLHAATALSTKEKLELQRFVKNGGQDAAQGTTISIYTKCGKQVTAVSYHESYNYSESELADINLYFIERYPNVTVLSNSSKLYNSHSYAWNMTDGGTECCIYPDNGNLDKYMKNDYYAPASSITATTKIYYYKSNHSAVASTTIWGLYESKWGRGPLMRHAPEYGPYPNMSQRQLYNICNVSGVMSCSNGNGPTSVGVVSTYSPETDETTIPYGPLVQYSWSIVNTKGDEVAGTTANIQTSGTSANISFNKTGIYEIYFSASVGGVVLASFWFEALVQ